MERYVIVIPADEEQKARLVRCDDGDTCKLETLQTLVGGPIETAESCLAANWAREDVDSIQLIVNEEGLLQELPFNERETICGEWNLALEEAGEECRCQTFSPD